MRDYRQFYGLLKEAHPELDRDEAKEMLMDIVSEGRTTSLRELTDAEFAEAIRLLRNLSSNAGKQVRLKKWRSALLHQLQLYGVNTADWGHVDAFCLDPRIAGKKFRQLDAIELELTYQKMKAINSKQTTNKHTTNYAN